MRHQNKTRKFGRVKRDRDFLLKGLMLSLIKYGKIETTEAKAKELRKFIEPLVTKAKAGTVAAHRLVASRLLNSVEGTKKLVTEIAPKYKDVAGGYTRVIKTGTRLKDSAKKAIIEFV
jgi:large subunit ribosomal protein L17